MVEVKLDIYILVGTTCMGDECIQLLFIYVAFEDVN